MHIRLIDSLGKEISAYTSYAVPRVKEFIRIAVGDETKLFKVWDVHYQVQNGECTSVDLEVLPHFEVAASSEKL